VPEGYYRVPLGQARRLREGRDVTIVGLSYAALDAVKAARTLATDGIDAEVIDLRTLSPRDDATVLESIRKTGRLVVADQGSLTCGYAADVVASVVDGAFGDLKAAPIRVALPDIPAPTTRALSNYFYPQPQHIVAAARRTLGLSYDLDPLDGVDPADKTLDVPDQSFTGPF
jgi:pyruvate/2-oxoglutarate/acetoin dehydrogenase E1 component